MCINDRLIFLCVATRHTYESYTVSGPKNNDESTNGVPQFSSFFSILYRSQVMTTRAQTPWPGRQPPPSSPRTAAASSPTK